MTNSELMASSNPWRCLSQMFSPNDWNRAGEKCYHGYSNAAFRKKFAVSRVKSEFTSGWNSDLTDEYAFRKLAASIIHQPLSDASKCANEAGHAGVSGADHRPACFYASEDRVIQMLLRA